MPDHAQRILENLTAVRGRIADAAARSGRTAADIRLVAITKYVGVEETQALADAGCLDLGESRPQALWTKATQIKTPVNWHLVGHLQRNKLSRTLPLVALWHSGDSPSILAAANESAATLAAPVPTLIEVNISGDPAKQGLRPDHVADALPQIARLSHIAVRGLMAMAGREGDLVGARREFSRLRELRDSLVRNAPPQISLAELSLGMSGDFEIAIEEGATMVRIGSILFEGIVP